ncbi:MAG TPA: toprim domain-containing protein [Thermoplasmata archaeon]
MVGGSVRTALWPEFQELWGRLVLESRIPGTVVVVEGVRDRRSLARLGVNSRVVVLHHGRPLSGVAHELAGNARRVIVLTDWDTEGGHLARRLKEFLEAMPLELDTDFRRRLARLLRGELVHVEGLAGWARRTAEAVGTPLESWLAELDAEGPSSRRARE